MTMYRAMVYYLRLLLLASIVLAALQILNYNPLDILIEAVYLALVCYAANRLLGKAFSTKPNSDSAFITAHILALITGPVAFQQNWLFFTAVAVLAMLSKYVVVVRRHHLFNPAALAVALTGAFFAQGASWWVGTAALLPVVIAGGVWIETKIRRWHLVASFLITYLAATLVLNPDLALLPKIFLDTAIVFFALVMLVEPITAPAGRDARIYFGIFTAGTLALTQKFLPQIPYTLELSLLAANVFAFFTKPQGRLVLRLNEKLSEAANTMTFRFEKPLNFDFVPGQYLEWVLPHPHPDSRGIKRYFTIATSPTEKDLQISTRLAPEKSSSFKVSLQNLQPGDEISASELDGDFVLPRDPKIPLVLIAGGIGITPFRSMIKYLLDRKERRDIVLLYLNKTEADIAFRDLLENAAASGLRAVFVLSERDGKLTAEQIKKEVPDWQNRTFYVSGPEPMVETFEQLLKGVMGIRGEKVKRDYFPGYESI
ncbi:MAG: oxidoreductase [Candidatus Doudnabacteria bacterium]|nr:oxidoreductase [Candidatus Doudnabacteria bacterium]